MTLLKTVAFMLAVSAFLVLAQILIKFALDSLTSPLDLNFLVSRKLWSLLLSKYFIGSLFVMLLAALGWFYVLRRTELSLVYSLVSLSYVLGACGSLLSGRETHGSKNLRYFDHLGGDKVHFGWG